MKRQSSDKIKDGFDRSLATDAGNLLRHAHLSVPQPEFCRHNEEALQKLSCRTDTPAMHAVAMRVLESDVPESYETMYQLLNATSAELVDFPLFETGGENKILGLKLHLGPLYLALIHPLTYT